MTTTTTVPAAPVAVSRPRRRGWAYTGAMIGGGVSIAANVAHSFVPPSGAAPDWAPMPGAVALSTFWPVFLFVAVEILARTPWPSGARWALLRYVGLLPVALVAALVSYRHLSGLMGFYGEDELTATIGPLAVDGIMVMATGALLATADTVTTLVPAATPTPSTTPLLVQPTRQNTAPAAGADPARQRTPRSKTTGGRTTGGATTTAAKVARLRERHPDWTYAQIAAKAEVSERTVARYLAPTATDTTGADTDREAA